MFGRDEARRGDILGSTQGVRPPAEADGHTVKSKQGLHRIIKGWDAAQRRRIASV